MITKRLILCVILTILAHIIVWYQCNSQFVWKWWQDKPIITVLIFALPSAFLFYYSWTFAVKEFSSLWSARLFLQAASYLVFPAMTWFYLDESPFKLKTMICIFLSFVIIVIQMLL